MSNSKPRSKDYRKNALSSFAFAWWGISYFLNNERNAKFHSAAAIVVILMGWFFDVSPIEWCVLIFCIGMVFSTELLNTAIELLVDTWQPDHHPTAGKIKDVAAGSVLVAAGVAAVCGGIIFVPKILDIMNLQP